MNNRPLDPKKEINISPATIIFGSFVFAVVFFAMGSFFRHYVWVTV